MICSSNSTDRGMGSDRIDTAEIEFFQRLQSLVSARGFRIPNKIRRICGVDAAYSSKDNRVVAAATLFVDGRLEKTSIYTGRFTFPYVSGLFFLHEGPFVVAAVRKLEVVPQLVCFDAHGLAHPRLKGLATVCGMVLEIPSIGIAKSALVGEVFSYRLGLQRMAYEDRCVGYVTTEAGKRYWSSGYSMSVKGLEEVIRKYGIVCRSALEEAHRLAKKSISNYEAK